MRTTRKIFERTNLALTLIIAAMPILVNGKDQSLPSVNHDNSSTGTTLRDSVKDAKGGVSLLIEAVLKTGTSENTGKNLAPVIGLPKAMPTKDVEIPISDNAGTAESRRCFVVYEKIEGAAPDATEKRAMCAYIVRTRRSGLEKETKYFKLDLTGKLEKVILSRGKYDASGKVVRGSGVKTDLDIDSPEVRKTFEAEMDFWLNDWLKKQPKAPAKKA